MQSIAPLAVQWIAGGACHRAALMRRPVGSQSRWNYGQLRSSFIIFIDRIFTTFIERPFTNAIDARRKTRAMSCL
jgi:hypothetical protein